MPAATYRASPELMRTLLSPESFAAWERQRKASEEFWRTLRGPAQRPLGSNADEWNLFVAENMDNPAYLAVQIAEAIEEAERRGFAGADRCVDCGSTGQCAPGCPSRL